MIKSILDTDLYKFTTSYAYMKMFPHAKGTFEFIDRNKLQFTQSEVEEIKWRVASLSLIKLTKQEQEFMLTNCYYLPPSYFEWLSAYQFDKDEVTIDLDSEGHLRIYATGYLYRITLWEVPLLAIVSEIIDKRQGGTHHDVVRKKTIDKCKLLTPDVRFSEFGTRRRASAHIQDNVVGLLCENAKANLTGTSNCYFAMKYGLTPMGTHPHEWFMFHGAMYGYEHANYMALENWCNVYGGDLGIALTDTYTTDVFFRNFSKKHAKLFDGVRHDSGSPFVFINKVIKKYTELGIDPRTKTIIFSDGLDFIKIQEIKNHCYGRINCAFGIGTYLTNDTNFTPPNVVMKLKECQMNDKQPIKNCVKLSDVEGKHTGDPNEVALAELTLNL